MTLEIIIISENVSEELVREVAEFIDAKAIENLNKNGTIDTGNIARSRNLDFLGKEARIEFTAPHADFIEYGTLPHTPPIEPIRSWAKRKLGVSENEVDNVAWGIVNKIKKEGTEAQPFIRPAIDEAKSYFGD